MKIAYICADPGVPIFGRKGCSIHVQEIIRAFQRRGAEVCLFAARLDGEPPEDLPSLRVRALPELPRANTLDREAACLAANETLRHRLEAEGPFDFVYERYSLWSYAGMDYARAAGFAGLLEVNSPLVEEHASHRVLIHRARAEDIAERVFSTATKLIAVSEEVGNYLQGYPATHGRVHVIPNGVSPERFRPGLQPAVPAPDVFTIGFVGTLKPWHGLDVLLEAFAELWRDDSKVRLLLVGDGPEREALLAKSSDLNLQAVAHFTGAVDPRQVPGLLASMDVAVAPYPALSNFYFSPLKVYEYMAAGLPVVASRIGQLGKLIRHGENGLLTPPGDVAALAAALRRVRNDKELRRTLGDAAREIVLREHTWNSVADRICRLVQPGIPQLNCSPSS